MLQSRYIVLGTYLIASVVLGVVYATFTELSVVPTLKNDTISTPILSIAIWTVLTAVILLVGRLQGLKLRPLFGMGGQSLRPVSYAYGALLVASLLIFSLGSFSVVFYFLALSFPDYAANMLKDTLMLGGGNSNYPQLYDALMLFLLVLYAPFVEELVFRGILLQRWGTKWGLRWGLVGSSLLFGLLHENNPLGLTLFGFAMGLLYVRTRRLWVPIVCHSLNNVAAVTIDAASKVGGNEQTYTVADVQDSLGIGVVMMLMSAPFLAHFVWRSWPRRGDEIPYVINLGAGEGKLAQAEVRSPDSDKVS
ncbi:MAG: type II CAAX endopeptidase family protein [Cyanobacteria bacterium J06598_3]